MPTKAFYYYNLAKISSCSKSYQFYYKCRNFSKYMENRVFRHHQNNNLSDHLAFASFLGSHFDCVVEKKTGKSLAFLNTKINKRDNENRWITWNNYLTRLKLFFDGYTMRGGKAANVAPQSDWETPVFLGLKKPKVWPCSRDGIMERDEILFILRGMNHINVIGAAHSTVLGS